MRICFRLKMLEETVVDFPRMTHSLYHCNRNVSREKCRGPELEGGKEGRSGPRHAMEFSRSVEESQLISSAGAALDE